MSDPAARDEVTLYVGDLHAAARPTVVCTLLGSCIAACLWDPVSRVGGMNHFMLPRAPRPRRAEPSHFGVHAMELLVAAVVRAGADRRRLRAKLFGGGHVLDLPLGDASVPQQNVAFALEYCRAEGLDLVSLDVGGRVARQVRFQTDTGRAWVRRLRTLPVAPGESVPAPPDGGQLSLFPP